MFPVYFWLGSLGIHTHFLFESLAYSLAFRLVLRNVPEDTFASGIATSLPWGVDFCDEIHRNPIQLYEVIFLVGLMVYLRSHSHYQMQEGDLFKFYLISYLGFRVLIDFIKPDFRPLFGLSAIQIACFFALLYYRRSLSMSKLFQWKVSFSSESH